jgi:hypothetical protein
MKFEFFNQTHSRIPSRGKKFDDLAREKFKDEEYLIPLRAFFEENHRSPTATEIDQLSQKNLAPTANTYLKRWLTLNAAFKAAGLPEGNPSKGEIPAENLKIKMRDYVVRFQHLHPGQFPKREDIVRDSKLGLCPSIRYIYDHYGGLKKYYQIMFGRPISQLKG